MANKIDKKDIIERLEVSLRHRQDKIRELEHELNVEKDAEDTWGGHDGPDFMDRENELQVMIRVVKDLEETIAKLRK